ncbi:hypothetical protein Cme02nite_38390 [Catellatospora methionotrophica]|uniref:Uncharacterized protein n=1 Tax=Catellatospora methionotrophica TaxID=121620 RepID=A0A8J3L6X6_9ACTN|nr:hypothetical protein [Catellatospora methionotrophica]GIG15507.1 hypothetical protein Cme02nite_38390 [Catellatospora methionotrophica]
MSVSTIRTIHCDRCAKWTDGNLDPTATATQIRRKAKRNGWRVAQPGGEDTCPDCVAMETCTCGPHRLFNGVMHHAPECPSQAIA